MKFISKVHVTHFIPEISPIYDSSNTSRKSGQQTPKNETKATFLMGEKPVQLNFPFGQSSSGSISMRELVHYNNDTFLRPMETSLLLNSLLSAHQPSMSSPSVPPPQDDNYVDARPTTLANNSNDFSPILPKPTPLYPSEVFSAAFQLAINACLSNQITLTNQVNQNDNWSDNQALNEIGKLDSFRVKPAEPDFEKCSVNENASINNLFLRNESVIQSPRFPPALATSPPLLPTCAEPKIHSNILAAKSEKRSEPKSFPSAWLQPSSSSVPSSSSSEGTPKATKSNSSNNRLSYPREFKLMVIERYVTNGRNKYRTCKEFQITKSMLNGWLQKAEKIRSSRPGSLKSGRSGRRPLFPAIEKQLYQLYSERQRLLCSQQQPEGSSSNNNNSVGSNISKTGKISNRWIRETAKQLARQQCSEQELLGMCQFSERWLTNFKKRYLISTK